MPNKDFYVNKCSGCGATIGKDSNKCRKCAGKSGPSAKSLPSDKEILKMVEKTSQADVARQLGVSIAAIKKIMLKYRR